MKKIEKLLNEGKLTEAKSLIMSKIEKKPNHWLLSRMSCVLYEEKNYQQALEYAEKSLAVMPDCPLSLWDKAGALHMLGRKNEAITVYNKIIYHWISEPNDLCWESKKKAKSLLLDCLFMLGKCYLPSDVEKSKEMFSLFKKGMSKKYIGLYSLEEVPEIE